MTCCTFFGHKDTPNEIAPLLRLVLVDLIENKNVDTFYVGNNGNFDRLVYRTLCLLKERYPQIQYTVVLAYMPTKRCEIYFRECESLLPDDLENASPRYAIVKRNDWMIAQATYVITYVKYIGGAKKSQERAQKKGKTVINLAE